MYLDNTYKSKYSRIKINRLNKIFIKKELYNTDNLLSNVNGYSLDLEQRKAVITDETSTLIVAGAGSGKSLTIIGKIMYLIERKQIQEEDILCITFTREAAKNLEKNLKKYNNYNIKVYTFHKLALNIIGKGYTISATDTLEYIIDEYFNCIIHNNAEMVMRLKYILGYIDTEYSKILKTKEFLNLKKLVITFINLFKTNNYKIDYFLKIKKNKYLVSIIFDIYYLYEEELKSTNSIDFNDMITLSIDKVKDTNLKYKYIIVDEYQDTSYVRYLLLKSIIDKTKAKIICVGDDYQSIYRFNGCDIGMFINFKKYYGYSKILRINNTYRNSQELINVAGSFIMKNKHQLYKKLKSNKHIKKPIKIMYSNNLYKLLDIVIGEHKEILILGRNNFDINKYFKCVDGYIIYKNIKIKYLTIHASKGLEGECVVIINNIDDILGIPNKMKDEKILSYVKRSKDNYPYEEERRLFYVALTRTKTDVYLLVDKKRPSIFIKELIKDYNNYIEYI